MEPKFQSSFIPKGPVVSTMPGTPMRRRSQGKSLFYFLSIIIFSASVLSALGVFGYKFYLKYRIEQMGVDLENARMTLQPEAISELTRLDNRLLSSQKLIAQHQILSPLFKFLEASTPKTVRFNEFNYAKTSQGLELSAIGEARGYAALALQSDIFSKSQYFKNSIFSHLTLNDNGDVSFSLKTMVDPTLVSYQREVELIGVPLVAPAESTATSTNSTSSSQAATSTTQ
ncbi:MAG: hypothetical protein HYX23_01575 [Candidatus Zambryskibacteria bacterium]|nr:hypothetical protein [Candidatus Zambryskibacteria bacterium]